MGDTMKIKIRDIEKFEKAEAFYGAKIENDIFDVFAIIKIRKTIII